MGEKHNAEGGEWRGWAPGSRSQANERESDAISVFLAFLFFIFTFELETGEPSHMPGSRGGGGGMRHTKKVHTPRKKQW